MERTPGQRKAEKSSLAGWKPKSHAQERPFAERLEAGGEPTVNIHIGRIEVRAIMPSPPPAPKAEPGPPLSLAEYLKRRHQETR